MIHRWISRAVKLLLMGLLSILFLVSLRLTLVPRHRMNPPPPNLQLKIIEWSEDRVKPDNRRIFFHETSGRQNLSFRQSCAVESAAKHNPSRSVQIFMLAHQLNYSDPWISALEHYRNVAVILVDEEEYFRSSPLEEWFNKGEWRKSRFKKEHMSDYIRILTLYKGGGMFLDLDIITRKPYHEKIFWNFFQIESAGMEYICNGIIHLEKGHRLIKEVLNLLIEEYDPADYIFHGPQVISAVMSTACNVTLGIPKSNQCKDVRLLSHRYFFPIESPFWGLYFQEPSQDTMKKVNRSYGAHVWNSLSYEKSIDVLSNKKHVYSMLAIQNCPFTVENAAYFDT